MTSDKIQDGDRPRATIWQPLFWNVAHQQP